MSTLLDDHQTAAGGVSDRELLARSLAEYSALDVDDMSLPEVGEMKAVLSRGKSWLQGMRVRADAHHAKLVEAAKPKLGAKPDPDAKPDPAPPPKPGGSRKEQRLDADAARAVAMAPSFGFALESGLISLDHVAALGRVHNPLQVPAHEANLLGVAKMRTAEDFVKWLVTWDADRDREAGIDRSATQRRR